MHRLGEPRAIVHLIEVVGDFPDHGPLPFRGEPVEAEPGEGATVDGRSPMPPYDQLTDWSWPEVELDREFTLLIEQLPRGKVVSYGAVARALGDVVAASWVARRCAAWRAIDDPRPWQRVVRQDGSISGTRGRARQVGRLQAEGHAFDDEGRLIAPVRRLDLISDVPLQHLARWQLEQSRLEDQTPPPRPPRTLAGLDVSYPTPDEGVAAYVEYDVATRQQLHAETLRGPATFPYISGYLMFRELPLLAKLLEQVAMRRPWADGLLVDGSGRLHPRGFGIACGVARLTGRPCVGVAKSRPRSPSRTDEVSAPLGVLFPAEGAEFQVHLSVGGGLDLATAASWVGRVWDPRHGVLPITAADRLSRAAGKR